MSTIESNTALRRTWISATRAVVPGVENQVTFSILLTFICY